MSSSSTNGSVTSETINVKTCTSNELASSLIKHRPGGTKSSLDFLKKTIQILEEKVEEKIGQRTNSSSSGYSAQKAGNANTAAGISTTVVDLGASLLEEPFEGSFLSPRLGKFSIQLFENGLKATKANDATVQIILSAPTGSAASAAAGASSTSGSAVPQQQHQQVVSHIVVFPKPEDCKTIVKSDGVDIHKTSGNLVLVQFHKPMTIQNKQVEQLCFTLPSEKKVGPIGPKMTMEAAKIMTSKQGSTSDVDDNEINNNNPTTAWCQLLYHSLSSSNNNNNNSNSNNKICLAHVQPGRPGSSFESFQPPNTSTTSGGLPFVTCYSGVNDGVLYPLREGLLFFKPPRFIPRGKLHSISCGRGGGGGGGGSSSSRYVDMHVTLMNEDDDDDDDDDNDINNNEPVVVEFTNIQREENPVLNKYIHNVLIPAMQQDAAAANTTTESSKTTTRTNVSAAVSTATAEEIVARAVTKDDTTDDHETDDGDDVVVEADVADDDDDDDNNQEEFDDDDDEEDEDFDDSEDESEDDDDVFGNNGDGDDGNNEDDGFTVVRDDFAKSLVKKKQEEGDGSATESEDDDYDDKPRKSKRLRQV
jgi:Histone chaperone Rttp106-like